MNSQLSRALEEVSSKTRGELLAFFSQKRKQAEDTDATLVEMVDTLQEFILRGGKRIRPFLCWCGYMLADGKASSQTSPAIFRAGAAIEALHFYLLNLDDMADRDTVRHGGPTIHKVYESQFVKLSYEQRLHYARSFSEITGALLGTYAYELMRTAQFPERRIIEAIGIMNKEMFQDTATGWKIHMTQNWEPLKQAKEERFVKGLRLVTAQYTFVGPLLIGATLAGKRDALQRTLTEYGMQVGTAFQIHDDILGLFGDPKHTGKAVGNDVREGKKTLLLQDAYRHAEPKDQKFLEKATGDPKLSAADVARVQAIVKSTQALERSRHMAQEYVNRGIAALSKLPDSPYKTLLKQLAEYVITREK